MVKTTTLGKYVIHYPEGYELRTINATPDDLGRLHVELVPSLENAIQVRFMSSEKDSYIHCLRTVRQYGKLNMKGDNISLGDAKRIVDAHVPFYVPAVEHAEFVSVLGSHGYTEVVDNLKNK